MLLQHVSAEALSGQIDLDSNFSIHLLFFYFQVLFLVHTCVRKLFGLAWEGWRQQREVSPADAAEASAPVLGFSTTDRDLHICSSTRCHQGGQKGNMARSLRLREHSFSLASSLRC